ncbi:MAG: TIGR03943 family protein [Chloroflexota bacterium]|nr:TIGR03943 family protein [Chloroflexota bacterium]
MTTYPYNLDATPRADSARNAALRGWLKVALLIGLGAYFIYIIGSGSLTNYINERFAWLSYVAAALFIILGVFGALDLLRKPSSDDHQGMSGGGALSGGHAEVSWTVIAIVAVPLVLGTLIPSRPLGAEAINGQVRTSASAGAISVATFERPPLERNVLDWLRAFNSAADYNAIAGQPADVIGFVYNEPTFDPNTFMTARFTVSCCVADASAIGVPVYSASAASLPQGEWVRVQGTFAVREFRGESLPVLMASSIEVVPQPEHPYLYP